MIPSFLSQVRSSIHVIARCVVLFFLICFAVTNSLGAIGIDQVKSTDRSSASASITSPTFSTTAGNELLLAFISTDAKSGGITVTGVSSTGLTWAFVQRANAQLGTSEIWRAFAASPVANISVKATLSQSVAASITIVTLTGTDTSGVSGSGAIGSINKASAPSGAPTASLLTSRDGSMIFGVGNDWDNSTLRTLPSNQTLIHQYPATIGDCYWVQRITAPLPAGSSAVVNDTAPTTDRYNLAIVEVLAAPAAGGSFSVSGSATPASAASNANVTLTQGGSTVATASIDSTGNYTFSNIANGTYTVTPAKAGVFFSPASQTVNVNGAAATVQPFTAAPQVISGTASPIALANGATVTLSQNSSIISTSTVDANGNYSFSGVVNGTYSVVPGKAGIVFSPSSQSVTINGGNAAVSPFTASVQTWTVSGSITPTNSGMGALVSLDGTSAADGSTVHLTATAGTSGTYSIAGVPNGSYTVTPTKDGYTFGPASQSVTISNANGTANFTATPVATFTISGTVSSATDGPGTLLTLSGSPSLTTTADASGNYQFTGLGNNTYTVTPSKTGFTFNPPSLTITVSNADVPNVNFVAQAQQGPPLNYPDLSDILPASKISITGTGNGRVFQYTHDTFNGGSGPLVIQPTFNAATGNYQGVQYVYSFSGGKWTLSQKIPVAGVFIFDSDHGHFHFPFTTYGLYTVGSNGGIGTPVATSGKVSYCIDDSFIYDPTLPNAGALGNIGSCTDPTSLRGLDIGAVDEYDQTDPGQSIFLNGIPDGTYWLRAVVDPNNFLAESDKTNNETDIELTITGSTVQVLQTVTPKLNNPPVINMTAPANNATLSGVVQLAATPTATTGVQFLLDGVSLGTNIAAAPYTMFWDTTTVQDGTHWLAAQTTDATGITGTSAVVLVTVANGKVTGPTVQITSPTTGSILSSTVTLYATAGSSQGIANVSFAVDGAPVGSVTAAPYMIAWDSTTIKDGQHSITATATDTLGNSTTSVPATVTVDNSHPALPIGEDVVVSADGAGVITTQSFSTTAPSDLLVAFVSYDGPSLAQTATVSGAGLVWTLLERSNTQDGTAEIWSARADGTLSGVTVFAEPGSGGTYHGSLTVIAFTNAAGTSVVGRTGAPSGAPDISLPGVISGDWVFAVGNDWDRPVARVPVSGQVLVHQKVDTNSGDTYWVQATAAPSTANAIVDIHDTSPTTDRWNYAAVEIVAAHQ